MPLDRLHSCFRGPFRYCTCSAVAPLSLHWTALGQNEHRESWKDCAKKKKKSKTLGTSDMCVQAHTHTQTHMRAHTQQAHTHTTCTHATHATQHTQTNALRFQPWPCRRAIYESANHMSKKQALFAVVEYLHELVATKGAVPADSVESVEVAIQCLNDAFGLEFDASAPQSSSLSLKARGLGLEGVIASALGAPSSATSASSASAPATAGATPINYEQILAASEALKSQGNVFMKDTKYEAAIDSYAQAIKKSEGLPSANNGARSVYYANRYGHFCHSCFFFSTNTPTPPKKKKFFFFFSAAALLCIKSFEEAASDCEESVKLDPAYAKAYGRLGCDTLS